MLFSCSGDSDQIFTIFILSGSLVELGVITLMLTGLREIRVSQLNTPKDLFQYVEEEVTISLGDDLRASGSVCMKAPILLWGKGYMNIALYMPM